MRYAGPQMATELEDRLGRVSWETLHTIYGPAVEVPRQIILLHSPEEETGLRAAAELRESLCRRQTQIASAALPALPFLMEALAAGGDRIQAALLDLLCCFAATTNHARMARFASAVGKVRKAPPAWVQELHAGLESAAAEIAGYASSANPEIAEAARAFGREIGSGVEA